MSPTSPGRRAHRLAQAPPPRRAGRRASTRLAAPAVVAAVTLLHAACALLVTGSLTAWSLLLPAVAATLAWALARAAGAGRAAAAVAVAAPLASPTAVAALASPGAGALGLLVSLAGAAGWRRRSASRWESRSASSPGERGGRRAAAVPDRPSGHRAVLPWVVAAGLAGALLVAPLAAAAVRAGGSPGWGTGVSPRGWSALSTWASLDPVLAVLTAAAVVVAALVPGLRLAGAALLAAVLLVGLLGLPVAAAAPLAPLVGLDLGLGAEAARQRWSRAATPRAPRARRRAASSPAPVPVARSRGALVGVAAAVALVALVPAWAASLGRLPSAAASPADSASRWVDEELPGGARVAVDADLYARLAAEGGPERELVPVTGPSGREEASAAGATASPEWIVSTEELRAAATPGSWSRRALDSSSPVQVFGTGADRVEVRRIVPPATEPSPEARPSAAAQPSAEAPSEPSATPTPTATPAATPRTSATPAPAAGASPSTAPPAAVRAVEQNPAIALSERARAVLDEEPVDARLVALLVHLASERDVSVSDVPAADRAVEGEPRRTAVLDGLDGAPVDEGADAVQALRAELAAQTQAFRASVEVREDGSLVLLVVELPVTS